MRFAVTISQFAYFIKKKKNFFYSISPALVHPSLPLCARLCIEKCFEKFCFSLFSLNHHFIFDTYKTLLLLGCETKEKKTKVVTYSLFMYFFRFAKFAFREWGTPFYFSFQSYDFSNIIFSFVLALCCPTLPDRFMRFLFRYDSIVCFPLLFLFCAHGFWLETLLEVIINCDNRKQINEI